MGRPRVSDILPKRPYKSVNRLVFTDALGAVICERITRGETLTNICAGTGMPDITTVWKWTVERPAFAQAYARARELQAHALWDEAMHAARSATDKDSASVARGIVDAVARLTRSLNPKVYGDKIDVTTRRGVDGMSDDTLEAAIGALGEAGVVKPESVH